jgi:hypothetical protein
MAKQMYLFACLLVKNQDIIGASELLNYHRPNQIKANKVCGIIVAPRTFPTSSDIATKAQQFALYARTKPLNPIPAGDDRGATARRI